MFWWITKFGQTKGKKGLFKAPFSVIKGLCPARSGKYVHNRSHALHQLVGGRRQGQDEDHCDNAGTRFLFCGLIVDRQDDDLDFSLDDHLEGLIAMRTSHGECGLGVENSIFEDDVGAVRTVS